MEVRPLLGWLDAASSIRGIHFAQSGDAWDFWPYDRLAQLTRDVASGLVQSGVGANDIVAIIDRSGPQFVAAFFGAIVAGATPAPVAPPLLFESQSAYDERVARVLRCARATIVVTDL